MIWLVFRNDVMGGMMLHIVHEMMHRMAAVTQAFFNMIWFDKMIWAVTEKVWLRAMYSDGIAAETRKTEGDLKTEG